jgi:hypothetical protein
LVEALLRKARGREELEAKRSKEWEGWQGEKC